MSAPVSRRAVVAPSLVATIAVAVACWIASIRQMRGMDMGVATSLGSFPSFIGLWSLMMAAMMLPSALPAIARRDAKRLALLARSRFALTYLLMWATIGVAAYILDRHHGSAAAGAITILAGLYELTPLKRACRERCRGQIRSGSAFGAYCIGSSIGLMAILLALGVMDVALMVAIGLVVLAQKLLPPITPLDIMIAGAIVALGIVVVVAPSSVPT